MSSFQGQQQFRAVTAFSRRALEVRLAAWLGRKELPSRTELASLRPAQRALIAGLAGWIALVGLVVIAALISVHLSRFSTPAWLGGDRRAPPTGEGRVMLAFDNIVQRPLFSRSRQVVVAPPPSIPVALPPPQPAVLDAAITLKGVFMSDGVAKAFLLTTGNPVGTWVEADGEINGWRVVGISPGEVVLDGQNQRLVLPLTVTSNR
jgi:hypothetical protein